MCYKKTCFLAILLTVLLTGCGNRDLNLTVDVSPLPEKTEHIEIVAEEPTETPINTEKTIEPFPQQEEIETGTDADIITATVEVIPSDDTFVRVVDYIPDIVIDLKYATADNFTGVVIYDFSDAYLRYGTVKKLSEVQAELRDMDMGLKIWDAFRPVSAQFRLWEVYPDSVYVANPITGFSSHSRGNTVDITLVDSNGTEIQMPTGFDDFSLLADRDYSDCDEVSADHARLLENIMHEHGFTPYSGEWWHFSDSISYAVEDTFEPPA